MKKTLLYILNFLFAVVLLSCTGKEENEIGKHTGEAKLTLSISLATRGADNDVEVIKTLRVILLDESGKVTANELKQFDEPSLGFSEDFQFTTHTGPYRVYAIANEESIENYYTEGLTSDNREIPLSTLLSSFEAGQDGFDEVINSICYNLDATKPLPMTSVYDFIIEDGTQSKDIYLVNTSVRFDVYFKNYRSSSVNFTSVGIDKVSDQSYLMAKIDADYQTIEGDYWIDWMKRVTEETNLYPDLEDTANSNNLVNERLGWLTEYKMPVAASHSYVNFMEASEDSQGWELDPATPNVGALPTPSELYIGPFYYPESKYIEKDAQKQAYSLVIEVASLNDGPQTLKRELGYIKTLFRNTNVIIHVDMYSGSEDIYAEIRRWGETNRTYGQIKPE